MTCRLDGGLRPPSVKKVKYTAVTTELWSAPRLHGALSYFTTLINSPSLDNFVLHFYTVIILSDVLTLCVFTAAAR